MQNSRKLNEHVEEELFNKEKRTKPSEPKIKKVGEKPTPPPIQLIKEGENPVKKKRPYYRNKYNKPKLIEVITPEPNKPNTFITGLSIGFIVGIIITSIIKTLTN